MSFIRLRIEYDLTCIILLYHVRNTSLNDIPIRVDSDVLTKNC